MHFNWRRFYQKVSLKKPHSFYESQFPWHWKQNGPTSQLWRINFPENMSLFGVRNSICTAPFLDTQDVVLGNQEMVQYKCYFWDQTEKCFREANVCIFLYISVRKFYSRDVVRLYMVGGKLRVGWIISLRQLAVWAS